MKYTCIIRAKVMYDKWTFRDIEISLDASLHDLAWAIIESFEFQFDHPFGFYSKFGKKFWNSEEKYESFADTGEESDTGSVKKTKVGHVFQQAKKKMLFLFDYGDEWRFEVECKGFREERKGQEYPVLLKSNREPPFQYPVFDDLDDYDPEEERLLQKLEKALEKEAKS